MVYAMVPAPMSKSIRTVSRCMIGRFVKPSCNHVGVTGYLSNKQATETAGPTKEGLVGNTNTSV